MPHTSRACCQRPDSKCVHLLEKRDEAVKIVAIVLIIAGLLGLVYGNFSYTRETQEAKIGPLELSVKDTKTVNVPVWVGAVVAGGALLLFASRKS
ncbi:MAG: hypothetical protein WAV82_02615 [Methylobacter sp.]